MRRSAAFLALLAMIAVGAAASAATCSPSGPSSELILPYLAVDLSAPGGETTLFGVSNASDASELVRVDLYSTVGAWAGAYHVRLAPSATFTANLRDDVTAGRLICPPHGEALNPDSLRQALADGSGGVAGYAMIHAVSACSGISPSDPGFGALLVPDQVLVGDRIGVAATAKLAFGGLLLSGLHTGRHRVRYLGHGGAFDGTSLEVLMPGVGATVTPLSVSATDESGAPVSLAINYAGGLRGTAANRWSVDNVLAPSAQFGSLVVDCGEQPCAVGAIYQAEGRYAVGVPGVPLDCQ